MYFLVSSCFLQTALFKTKAINQPHLLNIRPIFHCYCHFILRFLKLFIIFEFLFSHWRMIFSFVLLYYVAEKIIYTVYVKLDRYRRADSMICLNFTSGDVSIKKTVTVTCNIPLQGKFIEIIASSLRSLPRTTLKVFEFERFGMFHL